MASRRVRSLRSQPYLSSWSLSWRWFSQLLEVLSQLTSYLILSPLHTDPGPWPGSSRILSKRKAPPFRKDTPRCTCHSLFWSAANQSKSIQNHDPSGTVGKLGKRTSKHARNSKNVSVFADKCLHPSSRSHGWGLYHKWELKSSWRNSLAS